MAAENIRFSRPRAVRLTHLALYSSAQPTAQHLFSSIDVTMATNTAYVEDILMSVLYVAKH